MSFLKSDLNKKRVTIINHKMNGLTSFQLKIIALICMTIDHIAAYGKNLFMLKDYFYYFRIIGRLAAPLFLFVLVQSVFHTKNKLKFIFRLYIAGVSVGLFQLITNFFLGDLFGTKASGNIIFTFFYIALYIYFIEKIIAAIKTKSLRQGLIHAFYVILSFLPYFLYELLYQAIPSDLSFKYATLIRDFRDSFFPSNYHTEYGVVFILLGIILYFSKSKKKQCIVFACFCMLCLATTLISIQSTQGFFFSLRFTYLTHYLDLKQCCMIFALPFMLLYNGQRGAKFKWLFYVYYPTHRYLISMISTLMAQI